MTRKFGSATLQDDINALGTVSGIVETGVTSYNESLGTGINYKDISLSKGGWSHGIAVLVFAAATGIGNRGLMVQFTDTISEGAGMENLRNYGNTYSYNAGASFLSGTIHNNFRIDQVYIENSTPSLRVNFYNTAGSPQTLFVSVHWAVWQ